MEFLFTPSVLHLENNYIVLLFGGVSLFLYGMTLSSQALEKLMASKISSLLSRLNDRPFFAIVTGISITTLLQSSGAVTSLLVGLGSAQVITLEQVMGVIIGTAIGSTLTVQLISFQLTQYSLPVLIVSFFIYFSSKHVKIKNFSLVFIGFSLLFLGLAMIGSSSKYFSELPDLKSLLIHLKSHPYLSITISMIFCGLVHSSAVTIGLAMGLAHAGVLTLEDALYWVYGANIGTTSTALLAAIGGNSISKQVAWAHFFYKTFSVFIFLIKPIHQSLIWLTQSISFIFNEPLTPSRNIANGHLLFNLLSAIIFYPFIHQGANFVKKLFPKAPEEEFGAEFLSMNNYQSSALAISYAQREIQRTADIVLSMIQDSLKMFESPQPHMIESIKQRDHKVDFLYREIKMFLLDHANKTSTQVHENIMQMILFVSNLERAADSIDINLSTLALKKNALRLEFSIEGWEELKKMHLQTVQTSMIAMNSFTHPELYQQAVDSKKVLSKLEIRLRENHILRLNRNLRESINTSSIHLDLLSEYKRIASLLCAHTHSRPTA